MTKKFTAMFLALVMCLSTATPALAVEEPITSTSDIVYEETLTLVENEDGIYEIGNPNAKTGIRVEAKEGGQVYEGTSKNLFMRIDATHFMKAEALLVDTNNYAQFQEIADEKELSDQLLHDIDNIMEKVHNNNLELEEPLVVYIPEPIESKSLARSETKTTRTYTGYAGMKYYQELLDCKGNSLEFNVKMPNATWKEYCSQVLAASVVTLAGAALDAVTGKSWSMLSVFAQSTSSSISTTKALSHTAKLFENKYTKYTYVIVNEEQHIGSVIDYTYNYFFRNFINVDGEDFYSNGDTSKQTAKVKGYDQADEYAYKNYMYYSYNARISGYKYENTSKGVSTYVDSLF